MYLFHLIQFYPKIDVQQISTHEQTVMNRLLPVVFCYSEECGILTFLFMIFSHCGFVVSCDVTVSSCMSVHISHMCALKISLVLPVVIQM